MIVPLLCTSIYYNIKFGIKILNMQDFINEALDVLDSREESIARVLEIPLFHDSREIRRVHTDLKASRNAILRIANGLTDVVSDDPIPDAEDENENIVP
jgi:hypothetical protein